MGVQKTGEQLYKEEQVVEKGRRPQVTTKFLWQNCRLGDEVERRELNEYIFGNLLKMTLYCSV